MFVRWYNNFGEASKDKLRRSTMSEEEKLKRIKKELLETLKKILKELNK
jgi:hypothetical protein